MSWKRALNAALRRATGYEMRKPRRGKRRWREPPPPQDRRVTAGPRAGDRLVTAPAFVLCTLRSGSTLLRVLLDSHPELCAPQELHLRYLTVKLTSKWGKRAMAELGLGETELSYILWDRILHRELMASGKKQIVSKTPNNVFIADRILECWPDARFIFLLRHPAAILQSRQTVWPEVDPKRNIQFIQRYCERLESARRAYPGHTVRYEELTADPRRVTLGICEFLGVPWEPEMLEYGRFDHGRYRAGLGDWKDKIRSGQVQPAAPLPTLEETPPALREIAAAWGYGRDERAALVATPPLKVSQPS
jgi:hypothetical protein